MEVVMKRVYTLKGLDCPNCSPKIEKEVGELDGVHSSSVNLMKQTLTVSISPNIASTIDVAKATKAIVMQNIVIALGIKSIFLILGAMGIAGMWEAVFGDVGVTIIAVLNAMRILKK